MQESKKDFIINSHTKRDSIIKNNRYTVMLNSRISRKINLLTYNVFMRPPMINNNGNDYKNKRLQYIIDNVLSFYDVICLQEMFHFGSNRRNYLLDEAHKAGFKHAYTSPIPCFLSGIDGGLVVLSRFPIVKAAETTFARGIHSDKLCHKGVLYCKIKVEENFHFHVFTTHTQASYESNLPLTEPSVQIRLEQIGETRRFITEQIKDQPTWEPVVLLGDLNVNSRYDLREDTPTSTQEYIIMHQILCGGDLTEMQDPNTKPQTLNFRDLLYDTLGHHPISFADFVFDTNSPTGGTPRETVLTSKESLGNCESLDYIFYLDRNDSGNASGSSDYYLELGPARIEPMFLPNPTSDFPCTQLSDHYGVSLEMIVTPKPPSTRDTANLLTPPTGPPPEVEEEGGDDTGSNLSRSSSPREMRRNNTPPSPIRKVSSSRRRISKLPAGAEDVAKNVNN